MDDFLRSRNQKHSLILLMMGDTDSHHTVIDSECGFALNQEKKGIWMDLSRAVGMLHVDLNERIYPARVYTHTGASRRTELDQEPL